MNTWVSVLVSVLASICSGMILFLIQHNLKRQQKAEEARESDKSLQTALSRYSKISTKSSPYLRKSEESAVFFAILKGEKRWETLMNAEKRYLSF